MQKCRKSRYVCGRILARILRLWKVYSMSDLWSMKILGRRKLLEEMGPKKLKCGQYAKPLLYSPDVSIVHSPGLTKCEIGLQRTMIPSPWFPPQLYQQEFLLYNMCDLI